MRESDWDSCVGAVGALSSRGPILQPVNGKPSQLGPL